MSTQDRQELLDRLHQARGRSDGLLREVRVLDDELEGLSGERKQHQLLHDVCGALEELRALGGADLFFGAWAADGTGEQHLRVVRGRVDAFEKRLGEIEERRQALLDELERAQQDTELLEDDLFEAQQREEQRKLEWIIERDVTALPERALVMPWTRGGEDDARFLRALVASLLLSVSLGLVLPLIDLPLPERWEVVEVPERFTRLIKEERPLAPPPPVQEQTLPDPTEPEPVEERVAEEVAPKASPQPNPKESAASKGILAFREKFSGLASSDAPTRLGAQARIRDEGEVASGRPERSMVATPGPGSSGGINLASLSRDVGGGGGQIEGVQVARATSSIGGGSGQDRPLSGGGPGLGRTDEEIQIVFDRHKAALYRLYNRELRRDPTLRGQMVLRIRIEPDGSVTVCELQSTDMRAPQLASQVLDRVRTFDFGAKEVPAITILYPIDFLPAT